jgi:hypothetical protein
MRTLAYPLCKAGDSFGRLTVLETLVRKGRQCLRCRCECGKEVIVDRYTAQSGRSNSCGCLHRDITRAVHLKHGDARRSGQRAPEHNSWVCMVQRCTNPKEKAFHRYGGRGIHVCQEWIDSYEAFLAYVGRKPSRQHTIERIDNNGHYEPGNVKWATKKEQGNNTSTNRFLEFNGKRLTVAQWATEIGMDHEVLRARLRYGWSDEEALTMPVGRWPSRLARQERQVAE